MIERGESIEDPKLYTIEEITKILKISQRTLYNYIKNKSLKAVKIGKHWRVRQKDLQELIDKGTPKV
ncbi:MAG: helix-turn-helix domain-containing protein [Firmicutes bacterium]|nr:helix-turn-helix domain-containing protein [Bacillota bacterium]